MYPGCDPCTILFLGREMNKSYSKSVAGGVVIWFQLVGMRKSQIGKSLMGPLKPFGFRWASQVTSPVVCMKSYHKEVEKCLANNQLRVGPPAQLNYSQQASYAVWISTPAAIE